MQRLTEILLGLDGGFLARDGDLSLGFRQRWPLQEMLGAASWNLLLIALAVVLVAWAYRREAKPRRWRIGLGVLRLAVLLLVVGLLNRPTLSLTKARLEPSVLAVLLDDSASMAIRDVGDGDAVEPRISVPQGFATGDTSLASRLAEDHELRLFRFADAVAPVEQGEVASIEPTGERTRVAGAAAEVLAQLRGQNVAGLVMFTDGKDAPSRVDEASLASVRQAGVPVYAVPVGGAGEPPNLRLEGLSAEPTVFAGDILSVVATVRAVGVEQPTPVEVALLDAGGNPVLSPGGVPVTRFVELQPGEATEVELRLEAPQPQSLDLGVVVRPRGTMNELDADDNRRGLRVDVLDAQIAVLYVDGYPRWEYRYLKNRLIRDETINASILLTSADPTFAQEGNTPIRRFPVTLDELLDYDVILFGDVSPQQFSDGQLELLREYVGDAGGGFGMVAGPRDGPWAWGGTPVEALLPIDPTREADPGDSFGGIDPIVEGWRPTITEAGERTGIFRFFADAEVNAEFLDSGIEPLFWRATDLRAKAGVGDVLATHPTLTGADGRPLPVLVAGRYGAGRTLFNGIDESWRWRYYTGEPVFDTFWVQQLRYLARGRKLGERRATLTIERPTYELGDRALAEMRVLDPQLGQQLPDRLEGRLLDSEGRAVANVPLVRRANTGDGADAGGGGDDRFTGTWPADAPGSFTLSIPPLLADESPLTANVSVELPRDELQRPVVDRAALARLAADTGGEVVSVSDLATLPGRITSAEKRVPVVAERALWDAPIALALLALLLTIEWVGRKVAGLV